MFNVFNSFNATAFSTGPSLRWRRQILPLGVADGGLAKPLDGRDHLPVARLRQSGQRGEYLVERTFLLSGLAEFVVNPLVALVIRAGLRTRALASCARLRRSDGYQVVQRLPRSEEVVDQRIVDLFSCRGFDVLALVIRTEMVAVTEKGPHCVSRLADMNTGHQGGLPAVLKGL